MTISVLVLGSRGMLGQQAIKYFRKQDGIAVIEDSIRFDYFDVEGYIEYIKDLEPDVILNCIGLIKQKSCEFSQLIKLNSLFPFLVARSVNAKFIHASTDCVFSGYSQTSKEIYSVPDCSDDYGLSKYFGELGLLKLSNAKIIRASVIGITKNYGSKGLMDWYARTSSDFEVKGFVNHYWNGITTLTWCEICHKLITEEIKLDFIQAGTKKVYSKYEMLCMFSRHLTNRAEIIEYEDVKTIDRSLSPNYLVDSLECQLNRYFNELENK
jgi:dTDP-4-dehydrorhamnose reductase